MESVAGAAATVMLKVAMAVACAESVTFTVKENVPAAVDVPDMTPPGPAGTSVGVPDMTPAELSERPAGKAPVATDQVYGGVPPVAARVVAG